MIENLPNLIPKTISKLNKEQLQFIAECRLKYFLLPKRDNNTISAKCTACIFCYPFHSSIYIMCGIDGRYEQIEKDRKCSYFKEK